MREDGGKELGAYMVGGVFMEMEEVGVRGKGKIEGRAVGIRDAKV